MGSLVRGGGSNGRRFARCTLVAAIGSLAIWGRCPAGDDALSRPGADRLSVRAQELLGFLVFDLASRHDLKSAEQEKLRQTVRDACTKLGELGAFESRDARLPQGKADMLNPVERALYEYYLAARDCNPALQNLDTVMDRAVLYRRYRLYQNPGPTAKVLQPAAEKSAYDEACVQLHGSARPAPVTVRVQPGQAVPLVWLSQYRDEINCLAFSPDGRHLATGAGQRVSWEAGPKAKGLICLWDIEDGARHTAISGEYGPVRSVAFSPKGSTLASGGMELWPRKGRPPGRVAELKVWDLTNQRELFEIEYAQAGDPGARCINLAAFSPDGATLATSDEQPPAAVQLWDVNSKRRRLKINPQSTTIRAIAFSRDGMLMATGSAFKDPHVMDPYQLLGDIKIWDPEHGELLATLRHDKAQELGKAIPWHHQAGITCLAFIGDGKTLVSGSSDGTIQFWDVEGQKKLATIIAHHDQVQALVVSSDGKWLATGAADGILKVWDVATRKTTHEFKLEAAVTALARSPNDKLLACAVNPEEGAGRVAVFDMGTRKEIRLGPAPAEKGEAPEKPPAPAAAANPARPSSFLPWGILLAALAVFLVAGAYFLRRQNEAPPKREGQ